MSTHTKLTIGMAQFDDFDGVYFTLLSLRLHHPEVMDQIEFVVIDNHPDGPEAPHIKNYVEGACRVGTAGARYIPMRKKGGTTQTRERIFKEANGDAVLCCDCHVLFRAGAIKRLIDYYDEHQDCKDLLQGPLVYDSLESYSTHFNYEWRSEMLGTWGQAWSCPCNHTHFTVMQNEQTKGCSYKNLDARATPLLGSQTASCTKYGMPPGLPFVGHERELEKTGFRKIGCDPEDEPFEIPAHGLGIFTCRKDAWLGFNEHMRGFGGEEIYIHEKYRQAGHKTLCLPFLQWTHRFSRPKGLPYVANVWHKVRNYVLGHNELGWPLDEIQEHFVLQNKTMPKHEWEFLIEDPVKRDDIERKHNGGCGSCNDEIKAKDIDQLFKHYKNYQQLDFNQHFDKIREYAGLVDHCTEFGSRDYGVIALAGGHPKVIRSYNTVPDGATYWRLEAIAEKTKDFKITISHKDHLAVDIDETDLLFIDSAVHTADQLWAELSKHVSKVRRFIIVHDTALFGMKGSDGGPGLKLALIRFMKEKPEWTVVYNTEKQHGLMVLSKNPEDKPKRPGILKLGENYLKHLADHVVEGMESVSKEQLQARLEVCWLCDLRANKEQCSLCGCPLVAKAKRKASFCDANKWAGVDMPFAEEAKGDTAESQEEGTSSG